MTPLLKTTEAAKLLGISQRALNALCRSGEVRFSMVTPRGRRFREEDLEEFVMRRRSPEKNIDTPGRKQVRSPAKADKASLVKEMRQWD